MSDDNTCLELVTAENMQATECREKFEASLQIQNLWGHSHKGLEAKKAAMTMLSTKTGMYAKIPLVCKMDSCPYGTSCPLLPYDLAPLGEYCPIETSQIELRAFEYGSEFELDAASFTDRNLVNEIITLDIMLERCKALMAKEGTPVIEITAGITENGYEIKQPAVSKAWEAYEKMSKKRNEAYQLMLATRKDKKGPGGGSGNSSMTEVMAEISSQENFEEVEQRPDHLKQAAKGA